MDLCRTDVGVIAGSIGVVATLVVSGCGPSNGPDAWPEVVHISADAVRTVSAPDELVVVRDMAPLNDGGVWILNTVEPFFMMFDGAGAVVIVAGTQGPGPTEFLSPSTLVRCPGEDNICVYDPDRHAAGGRGLVRLADMRRGETTVAERAILVPSDAVPPGQEVTLDHLGTGMGRPWVRAWSGGLLFAVGEAPGRGGIRAWDAGLVLMRGREDPAKLGTMRDVLRDPTGERGSASASLFGPYPLWATCGDSELVVYDPTVESLLWLDAELNIREEVHLPAWPSVPVTADRVFRLMLERELAQAPHGEAPDTASIRRAFESDFEMFRAQVAKDFAVYSELHCTPVGDAWIRRLEPDRARQSGTRWVRVRDRAILMFEFPAGFDPMVFEVDRIWGVTRDDMGRESPAWTPQPGL